jgi:UDP-GlcNAc:undecaprenyl-phosphate/decaprenyl-phosphate GlcNAc-1-phosphate transferase
LFLILTLGALSFLIALILTPLVRDGVGRFGFLDHPDGVRKKHAAPVPRVGGIAIVFAYVATFAVAFVLPFTYTFVLRKALPSILQLALVAGVVFLTGVLDDLMGLSAWQKLIGIGGASALAYVAGIRVDIHMLNAPAWPWLGFAITVVWLIGCTNAFNLIDGMDGLAAGVGLVATLTMLIAALTQGNMPLALATMPLAGCLLGFLRYNFNPASVFLGDSGSLLIGFLLGCYGALWSEKSVTLIALTVPLLALSIPLLDVVLSILRRYLRNRPIFQADRGHIHHKLLDRGFSPRTAVLTIYGLCSLVAVMSLLATALHNRFSGLIVLAFGAAAWVGIRHLEYAEFAMAGRMFLQGRFRRIIDSETRLLDFEKALGQASNMQECWTTLITGSREFGFQGVQMNAGGQVLEDLTVHDAKALWELRIPLADAQCVAFFRDVDAQASPLILTGFVDCVRQGLDSYLSRSVLEPVSSREPEVTRIPAAPELYYSASASSAKGGAS